MSLVASLLQAIVNLDGEALVVHVGEKPYVVAPEGQVEIASRELTLGALTAIVEQLLPVETQRALDEFGAIQYELPVDAAFPGEHFTVVAARGGDDVWIEVRRRRVPEEDHVPLELFETPAPVAAHDPAAMGGGEVGLGVPDPEHLWPEDRIRDQHLQDRAASGAFDDSVDIDAALEAEEVPAVAPAPASIASSAAARATQSAPGVVLPMARPPARQEPPPPAPPGAAAGLDRLLRIASARGASTLYLTSGARPSIRVDGEIQALEAETPLGPGDVESLLIGLMPERNREALPGAAGTEWISDVPEVGRVRCTSFRDQRGAGGIFRMMPVRVISADQLGLSREIQALAAEPEGLVLVAGPRSSGKSTLVSALVDLINRTRRDHVITIESEIKVLHERRSSLVSQREVRGSADEMLAVARAAMRENPDVLVIEELRSADLITVALDAAGSGHLVIGSLPAHTATVTIERIIDLYPPEYRRHVQFALAESLRGVVSQVLLRKPGGGRVAAREVLLNTAAVAAAIAEGKTSQLPAAIEAGRKFGMVPLNDALASLVQSGAVDVREAYRRAADRAGLLALLGRQGVDTSVLERLA